MRILADENLPGPIVFRLRELGHDTTWVLTDYPSLKDPQILELAESQERIVLTLDNGFRQLALQRRTPINQCGVIVLRTDPCLLVNLMPLVDSVLRADRTWNGYVSIVTEYGIEMLRPTKLRP
jgi:predicted nuclease of predicted toxin-antitoxin system